ncbi:MAG TPA: anti-sigma factor [Usitatibacter sp.]|nr:anti-sigma factor [Usitatibacter sp.]
MKLSLNAAQALAGAYALGTLRGAARRRFERMAQADPTLARIVERWELELAPLAGRVPPVDPPARVWRNIESRIAAGAAASETGSALWRAFALLAGGLATVLLAFFLYISTGIRGEPVFVAVLTAQDSGPRMVVSMHEPDLLRVRMVRPWTGIDNRSLELWVLPIEGAPRSLGLVANTAGDTMIRIKRTDPRVQGATGLAVSLEPPGGSPTNLPTGPVLCSGAIAPVRRT